MTSDSQNVRDEHPTADQRGREPAEQRLRGGAAECDPPAPAAAPAGEPEAAAEAPAAAADLAAALDQALAEIAGLRDQVLRARAETDNVRKRAEKERDADRRYAVESFARELLDVKDSLDLARAVDLSGGGSELVDRMVEGLDLTLKQLDQVFARFSIQTIDPAPGDRLDPDRHQAMTTQEASGVAPNHIVSVVQKGYLLHDRLLRPAMVVVARAPAAGKAEERA